ncbi:MAG: AtpZ/AtpI family protein [Candidatus Omnitrophica bacterium]|nr:AtpZ/AtpI family protein [Candidatus Omnitrophota bacterium]
MTQQPPGISKNKISGSKPSKSESSKYAWLRVVGQCAFIPTFLALYPIAFYWIGTWLDGWFGTTWIKIVFLFLGLFSGFRQTYFIIKKLLESLEE